MQTVRCEKGHFYDAEKYMECPHCLKNAEAGKSDNVSEHEEKETKEKKSVSQAGNEDLEKKKDILSRWRQKSKKRDSKSGGKSPKTVSFYNESTDDREDDVITPEEIHISKTEPHSVGGDIEKAAAYKPVSEVTVQFYSKGHSEEPVVGWLVCVEGDACKDGDACQVTTWHVWWFDYEQKYYSYTVQPIRYLYGMEKWSPYSDWSTTARSSDGNTRVKTKTQYQYRDRSPVYTYHFKRTVYGNFTDWSDKAPSHTDGLEITTREVYVY